MKGVKIVKRPWGIFKQFALNEKCTVKILEVKPMQELSLQKHKNREENWYFITPGIVQIGKNIKKIKEGEMVKIKKNTPHRLLAGVNKVKVLEISLGKFDEHDEVRLEDKYNRK
jgi:mannose-6-phosphate isomerase-like protein (cupin superfamily)